MSGIVALFERTGGRVGRGELRAMLDRMAHRGPDGRGSWIDGPACLGHQSLAATPQAVDDDQPRSTDGTVLTADLRLDNRPALVDRLPVRGPEVPDSDLLLAAYERWGSGCVDELVGAFAFAVWDANREALFCARDHFGVKPLYYSLTDEYVAVASEPKSLLALSRVDGSVDDGKIGEFLTGVHGDTERTVYEGIRRLPPAHAMVVESDGDRKWRYWDLDPTRTVELETDAAYERRFRDLFEQAVRSRLRTNGTVGTSLSGGLDSSSVTVVAREQLPASEPLHTFSNVFDEAPSSDEREFIETVTDRDGIEPHYVFLDDVGTLVDDPAVQRHLDVPPHNTMHFGAWELAARAESEDVGVLLEGALGDSAVDYGLGLLAEWFRTGRWLRLARELRAMGEVAGAPARHLFVRHAVSPLVPDRFDRLRRRLRGQPILEAERNPALAQAFVERTDLRRRVRELTADGPAYRESGRRRQYRSIKSGLLTATFETNDLIAAAHGFEPRHPFADKRLVEFSLAIPPSQKLMDGWTRSILRRALADSLPEKIRRRPWKTQMNEAFTNALLTDRGRIGRLLDDPGPLAEYFDIDRLRTMYESLGDGATTRDRRTLWRALSLYEWFEAGGPERPTTSENKNRASS